MNRNQEEDRGGELPELLQQALTEAVRSSFYAFVRKVFETVSPGDTFSPGWHFEAMANALEKVVHGKTTRLIINVPPRNLKSICASVALPAFLLGHAPARRIICASYSEDLAKKFANDFRAVLRSDWYQRAFPKTQIDKSKDTETEVQTTARGFRLATSPGGTLTGRGAEFFIIDDPIKPADADSKAARDKVIEWYRNTLLSRFDDPRKGALVLVMQRVHVADLAGHLLEIGGFEHLCLPAIAEIEEEIEVRPGKFQLRKKGDLLDPVRMPKHVLDGIKASMGSMHFNAQYQQAPVPISGNIIKLEWMKFVTVPPPRGPRASKLVLSWDTAMKATQLSDYSVCTVWQEHENAYYLLDVIRERMEYPALKRKAIELYRFWNPCTILIEDHGSGTSLIQDLSREKIYAIGIKADKEKALRMSAQSPKFEAGSVFFRAGQPWLEDLKAELLAFPNGRHDDQVDSISQALQWLEERRFARPTYGRRYDYT